MIVAAAPLIAAALVGVQVGAAMVGTRFLVEQLGPASIAFVRYAIALVVLLPALWLGTQKVRIVRADLMPIMLLGICQFGVLIALLNIGLRTVQAATAALVFASFPLLTLLVARVVGQEVLTRAKLTGVGLTIVGVAVALGPAAFGRTSASWGLAAVLASALLGAVCSVLVRPYLRRYAALPVGAWSMSAAALFLLAWSLLEQLPSRLPSVNAAGWLALACIGVSSGVGYFLWLWALKHASASRVTIFLALSPLTAIVLGAWWLGEAVSPRLWLALGLIGAGLYAGRERAAPLAAG